MEFNEKELKQLLAKMAHTVEALKSEVQRLKAENEDLIRQLQILENEKRAYEEQLDAIVHSAPASVPTAAPAVGGRPTPQMIGLPIEKEIGNPNVDDIIVKIAAEL